ncbi:MAG: DUF1854 domain-containing protein [Oscillospiraceae bacterium]|jgi:hypothetical protein|nr:DUF1854 domain-containing protein [Oscillospiraceae bacterium]
MRELRYIGGSEARIRANDGIFVDVEFFDGHEVVTGLEPRRLFPTSGLTKYITLLDSEGMEVAIVRDIATLMPDSREVLENSLREYYMIPKIKHFEKMTEDFGVWMWTVDTDRGRFTFEVRNHTATVKPLYDGRVLIKDANDNRYEVPNINDLDTRSQRMILPNL